MRSFESNLAFVRACVAELEDYERAEALFWTLSSLPPAGSPPFLQMTIGNIVLALDEMRALAASLGARDQAVLMQVQTAWDACWSRRSQRLEAKAVRELDSRLLQWQAHADDALEGGDLSDYSGRVRPRLCAARLLEVLGPGHDRTSATLARLEAIDARLETRMVDGPCVLGDVMAAVYPLSPRYRFLYRCPRSSPT